MLRSLTMRPGANPRRSRRRDQPRIEELAPLTRLLNSAAALQNTTQANVAEWFGVMETGTGMFTRPTASPATVSRWFRGDAIPTDEDFRKLSSLLSIPVENFFAVRVLEDVLRKSQPTVVSIGAWHYLACAGTTLLLAGVTMVSRVIHLRDVNLAGKTVIVSTLSQPSLAAYENELDGHPSSCLHWCWLATLDTLRELSRKWPDARFRLWLRDGKHLGSNSLVGQLVANDWVAIEATSPESDRFTVHVRGDDMWLRFVQPMIDLLAGVDQVPGGSQTLLYDSRWAADDPRFGKLEDYRSAVVAAATSGPGPASRRPRKMKKR